MINDNNLCRSDFLQHRIVASFERCVVFKGTAFRAIFDCDMGLLAFLLSCFVFSNSSPRVDDCVAHMTVLSKTSGLGTVDTVGLIPDVAYSLDNMVRFVECFVEDLIVAGSSSSADLCNCRIPSWLCGELSSRLVCSSLCLSSVSVHEALCEDRVTSSRYVTVVS